MANSLNRDLKGGDKLVMRGGETVRLVAGGFGDMSFTSGQAICVRREGSIEALKASGFDIDAEATMREHADANGWNEVASA